MARILVVDDYPHIARLLQRELTADGHMVTTAGTGEEALQRSRSQRPDAVVLDVMLPEKSGLEVLRELRADPATRDITVILLTALDQPADIARGMELDADWYLTKPFRPGDVAAVVRRFASVAPRPTTPAASSPTMLPLVEIDWFTMVAAEAYELAVRGQTAEGLRRLMAGLRRADGARSAGEPWADELVRRYEEVRDHYVARHGAIAA